MWLTSKSQFLVKHLVPKVFGQLSTHELCYGLMIMINFFKLRNINTLRAIELVNFLIPKRIT